MHRSGSRRKKTGPALAALTHDASCALTTVAGHSYALVLDDEAGGLAAAATLTLDVDGGHVERLVVSERCRNTGLEDRILGVAGALCEAFGCETLEVARLLHSRAA